MREGGQRRDVGDVQRERTNGEYVQEVKVQRRKYSCTTLPHVHTDGVLYIRSAR